MLSLAMGSGPPAIARVLHGARRRFFAQAVVTRGVQATLWTSAFAVVATLVHRWLGFDDNLRRGLTLAALACWVAWTLYPLWKRPGDEYLLSRVDTASNLADRLRNAWSLSKVPVGDHELCHAAIADGVAATARANLEAAFPWRRPQGVFWLPVLMATLLYVLLARPQPALPPPHFASASDASKQEAFVPSDDDVRELRQQVAALRAVGIETKLPVFEQAAAQLDALLARAENGQLSKAELLAASDKILRELAAGTDGEPSQVRPELAELGRELAKHDATSELGRALMRGDLQSAQAALNQAAESLAQAKPGSAETAALARALNDTMKTLDDARAAKAEASAKQEQERSEQQQALEQQANDPTASAQDRAASKERLHSLQQEARTQAKAEQQNQTAQKRALARLEDQLREAARDLSSEQAGDHAKAAQKMKYASDSAGEIDRDQRRIAEQKKRASQLEDLREALRRAKQNQGKGKSNDPFGQGGQREDFAKRAGGQAGSREAWKQGGAGKSRAGAGGNKPGGASQNGKPGDGPPGSGSGDGPGDRSGDGDGGDQPLAGDATTKSGPTEDVSAAGGIHGRGPSRRQTILAAAQKGFASSAYRQVATEYVKNAEAVVANESIPSAYKFLVRRYFANIRPRDAMPALPDSPAAPETP